MLRTTPPDPSGVGSGRNDRLDPTGQAERRVWARQRLVASFDSGSLGVLGRFVSRTGWDVTEVSLAGSKSRQGLIGEVREPIPAEPGQPERYDCEYRRNGTANLFVFLDAHGPWRHVKVTDLRTAQDFAVCMRDLADTHYPDADRIRVVMDNLSTHTAGALYETFPAPEAHRILQRLEFHYTPKHASWLNMVEIEIGVLRGQCLDRRIGERKVLNAEVEAWQCQRNVSGACIQWRFTTQKARDKLARAYPDTT
jgi:DDE superfamily endonuclease